MDQVALNIGDGEIQSSEDKVCAKVRRQLIKSGYLIPFGAKAEVTNELRRVQWVKAHREDLIKRKILTPRR